MPATRFPALLMYPAPGLFFTVAVPVAPAQSTPAWWTQTQIFAGLPTDPDATITVAQLNAVATIAVHELNSDLGDAGDRATIVLKIFVVNSLQVMGRPDTVRVNRDNSVNYIEEVGIEGITAESSGPGLIDANATINVYAHEVGHALGLSQASNTDGLFHDLGPWPIEFSAIRMSNTKGLMYPYDDPDAITSTPWIRQQDWNFSNFSATRYAQ